MDIGAWMVVVERWECGGCGRNNNFIVASAERPGGCYNNRVMMERRILLRLLRQVVTERPVSILICDVVYSVGASIRPNVRIGALNNLIIRGLDTVFQPTDSVSSLVSGRDREDRRFIGIG